MVDNSTSFKYGFINMKIPLMLMSLLQAGCSLIANKVGDILLGNCHMGKLLFMSNRFLLIISECFCGGHQIEEAHFIWN